MSDFEAHGLRHEATTKRDHCQALLLALVCAVLFLRSALWPGNALVPHPPELFDVHMAEAQAAGTFDQADAFRGNIGMTDKYLQSLCWDRVIQDRLLVGEIPRWTRDIGGGAPFVSQMAQPYQPINILLLALPSVEWYGWWYLVHMVLFGWFAYLFLRRIGCVHGAALFGLVAATLGMWTQCKVHHNVVLTAALSLWPMLSATHALIAEGARGIARRRMVGWLAMWTGLSWSTGFVPTALHASYLVAAYGLFCLFQARRGDRLRRLVPFGVGLGLGAILSLANMLPILMASAESARMGQFDEVRLRALSLEWDHLLSLVWPDLLSWPADRFYPDEASGLGFATRMPLSQLVLLSQPLREDGAAFQNWVETSVSIGLLPFIAAATSLVAKGHRAVAWFFAGFAALAAGMATATEPLFSLTKVLPGMTSGDLRRLVDVIAMPLVVLAGLGANAWLSCRGRWTGFALLALVIVASMLVLGWLLAHGAEGDFVRGLAELYVMDAGHPTVQQIGGNVDRATAFLQQRAAPGEVAHNYRALIFAVTMSLFVAVGGFVALLRMGTWSIAVLLCMTMIELLVLGLGPVQTVPSERVTRLPNVLQPVVALHRPNQPRPRIQRLVLGDKTQAHAALPGNMPGFLGLADANAYNPLPPARFEEFFESIEKGVAYGGAGVGSFHQLPSLAHPLSDLYCIRFVITRNEVPSNDKLVDRTPVGTGGYRLLERTTAMPRATFVREVDVIARPEARLRELARDDRDVRRRVVLEDRDCKRPLTAVDATADVDITQHDDERVDLQVTCSHDGYVRLADPYDPGWRATVDGTEVKVLVADHYLRAVYVGPGEHEVVFTYDGGRVVWPLRLTLIAWIGVLSCFLTGLTRRRGGTPRPTRAPPI